MCKEKVACSCSSLERMKDGDYFPDILNTSMPAQCSYIVRLQLRFYKGMPWNPFAQMLMFQSKLKKVLQQFTEACNILSHPITHHPFLRVSSQLVPHFVVVSFPPCCCQELVPESLPIGLSTCITFSKILKQKYL